MYPTWRVAATLAACIAGIRSEPVEVNISSISSPETDWASVYYGSPPLLIGNDATPDTGGFHIWPLTYPASDESIADVYTRRSSLTLPLYDIGGRDVLLTLSEPDTLFHVFEGLENEEVVGIESAQKTLLGDWSSICGWRSSMSGQQYVFIFGKEGAVQLLVRDQEDMEVIEVQRFDLEIEAEGCAVSRDGNVYFTSEDDGKIFRFTAPESTTAPDVTVVAEIEDITGLTIYHGRDEDFLVVAQTDLVTIYTADFDKVGEIQLTGEEDLEIQGLTVYQGAPGYLAFASESEDNAGFGIAPLKNAFQELGFTANTAYSPRDWRGKGFWHNPLIQHGCHLLGLDLICSDCSENGFCSRGHGWHFPRRTSCDCFAGFQGKNCELYKCLNDCSGNGECVGPLTCKCDGSWGGPDCSWLQVEATYETDSLEGDADDASIWVSLIDPNQSRIITTTKSEDGAGLAVFDLKGNKLQQMEEGEPNSVNIIYGFPVGDRKVDLAYAGCREDNTLCLVEITPEGRLGPIRGGSQPVKEDYEVYGSCSYKSKETGKQYLIVNSKTAEFLQYELTANENGALETTLVRNFTGGTGGQVEGCVADPDTGSLFVGEELYGLWRYNAEPDSDNEEGHLVDSVKQGRLDADVEGVTLVQGEKQDQGFLIVSTQGTSSINVYRRAPPHEFVLKFTVVESADGQIDGVTNTDGIAAISTALGPDFPGGLVVVHDDANELPFGGTSARASFKMISLRDILGAKEFEGLDLLADVDADYDPRA